MEAKRFKEKAEEEVGSFFKEMFGQKTEAFIWQAKESFEKEYQEVLDTKRKLQTEKSPQEVIRLSRYYSVIAMDLICRVRARLFASGKM